MLHSNKSQAQAQKERTPNFTAPNQLREYFQTIYKLQRDGDHFPVDLDDVWPLAYTQKRNALRVLENEFVEGEEFHLAQKGKVVKFSELENGVKITAKLTTAALEYLIARKIRPVFEVYRQVFHSVNTPINGIFPIYHDGVLGYPRKEFLATVKRSNKNGYRLSRRFPEDNFNIGRTKCISMRLAKYLQKEAEVRALQLELFPTQITA